MKPLLMVSVLSCRVHTGHGKPGKSWNLSEGHGKSWKSNMLSDNKKAKR